MLSEYYCHFKNGEIKEGACLAGYSGNGETRQKAMEDYANQIAGKLLIIDTSSKDRKEIYVPYDLFFDFEAV